METSTVGPYRLDFQLSEVGLAQIWTARKEDAAADSPPVALKLLRDRAFLESNRLAALLDEARAASVLEHEGLVRTLDLQQDAEGLYIAMELVRGPSLGALLQRLALKGNPLPPALIAHLGVRVATVLEFAAANSSIDGLNVQLVHRHLCPQNILIDEQGHLRLSDLGILPAEVHERSEGGSIRGKPSYMAPEQIKGGSVDPRTDVFSLGVILYEASCLKPLFGRPTIETTIEAVLEHEPIPLTELSPGFPDGLWKLINRCLAKDPSQRFQSIGELKTALVAASADMTKAGNAQDNLARLVTLAFPSGAFQPTAAAIRRAQSVSQTGDLPAADKKEHAWPLASGSNPLDPREIGNLRAELYESTQKARSDSVVPTRTEPTTGEIAVEAARSVLEETIADPGRRRIAIAAAVTIVVFFVLIAAFGGTDPEYDRDLKGLFEKGEYAKVEKHFIENHDKFEYFETAFVLASDARMKRLGLSPGPPTTAVTVPSGEEAEADPGAGGEDELVDAEPIEPEGETDTAVATADPVEPVGEPEPAELPEIVEAPAPEDSPSGLGKADRKRYKRARKSAMAGTRALSKRQYNQATRSFQQCIQQFELPYCHHQLGRLHLARKNEAMAVRHLRRYLDLRPKAADADVIRIRIKAAEGR